MKSKDMRNWGKTLGLFIASAALIGCQSKTLVPEQEFDSQANASHVIPVSYSTVSDHKNERAEKIISHSHSVNSPLMKGTSKFCYPDKYAAIIVNTVTGEILYGHNENDARHPASLSKLMTLYLTLSEIKAGRLNLNDRLYIEKMNTLSNVASLNVKPEDYFTVEMAIKGILTRSAKDASDELAKKISGSVPAFTKKMNDTAQVMGMANTYFTNPSGWPGDDKNQPRVQTTTASDMVRLLWALREKNPEYHALLGTKNFFFRIPIRNHALIPGADMGKTGWADASGYSTSLSFPRDDGHYIVVVFGGRLPALRDQHVEKLYNEVVLNNSANLDQKIADREVEHLALSKQVKTNQQDVADPFWVKATDKDWTWTMAAPAVKNTFTASKLPQPDNN